MHSGTQPCKKVDSQFPANSPPRQPPAPAFLEGCGRAFWEARKSAPRWESDGNSASSVPQKPEAAGSAQAPRGTLPATHRGTEPLTARQRDALPLACARLPGSQTPRGGEEHPGQLFTQLTRVRKARAWSTSQIPICSPPAFTFPSGKPLLLKEEGKVWGKGCRRNDCSFGSDPGGVMLGAAPLIDFSGGKTAGFHLQELFGLSQVRTFCRCRQEIFDRV